MEKKESKTRVGFIHSQGNGDGKGMKALSVSGTLSAGKDYDLYNDHHLVDFREEKQGQMESFRNFQQIHLEKGADATIHLLL